MHSILYRKIPLQPLDLHELFQIRPRGLAHPEGLDAGIDLLELVVKAVVLELRSH